MYTLIIVDDEVELREGLAMHFPWEKYGFTVKAYFGSAKQTLDFFGENSADVLLTDIRMPFMTGLELIRRIKDIPGNRTVFCLLSAYRDFDYAQEGIALGVKHYLVKPTDFEDIGEAFATIRQELDGRTPEPVKIDGIKNAAILQVISHMSAKIDHCSLQSIAEKMSLNPSYLSRLFKEETGENFLECLQRMKMSQAEKMLESPVNYRNKEIALALGYNDAQNFCRSFRKFFGMTPGEYRALKQKK